MPRLHYPLGGEVKEWMVAPVLLTDLGSDVFSDLIINCLPYESNGRV